VIVLAPIYINISRLFIILFDTDFCGKNRHVANATDIRKATNVSRDALAALLTPLRSALPRRLVRRARVDSRRIGLRQTRRGNRFVDAKALINDSLAN